MAGVRRPFPLLNHEADPAGDGRPCLTEEWCGDGWAVSGIDPAFGFLGLALVRRDGAFPSLDILVIPIDPSSPSERPSPSLSSADAASEFSSFLFDGEHMCPRVSPSPLLEWLFVAEVSIDDGERDHEVRD